MPRIWQVGVMNEHPTSNNDPCHAIVGRPPRRTPVRENGVNRAALLCHGKSPTENNQFPKRTFPVRFAHKFGKLSAGAKRGDSTQVHQGCTAVSQGDFRSAFALSVLFVTALWFGLCRELSGEWSVNEQYNFGVVRPIFRALPFLAPVAGPAFGTDTNRNHQKLERQTEVRGQCEQVVGE